MCRRYLSDVLSLIFLSIRTHRMPLTRSQRANLQAPPPRSQGVTVRFPKSFKVHDQGNEDTCTLHAVTAVHEIITGSRLVTNDLNTGKLVERGGSTVAELSRILRSKGQREQGGKASHRISFKRLADDISAVKKALIKGVPVVLGTNNFIFEDSNEYNLTLSNSDHACAGKHSVVIVGFCDADDYEGGGLFRVLNSHGRSWGDNGFGTVSYGHFLANNIEVHVPVTSA